MAQAGFTPIQLYFTTTAAAAPSAGNLANGELAVNITDGKLFYKDNGGVVRVLATAAGAAGDVVGPGSSTDNALVRFDGTTGKLVQSSVGILSDAGALSGLASVAATTFTGALTGNASTATTLQTSRTIWGQSFDGSANVTGALTGVTDLTASGSLTLNGGTANGVAYLNGSKVLTTGSALTFDGSTFTSTGVQGILSTVGGNTARMVATAGGTFFGSITAADVVFQQNSTEGMRLTSTGLGIGTSSPTTKLTISGVAATGATTFLSTGTTTNYNVGQFTNTGGNFYFGLDNNAGTAFTGSSAYGGVVGTGNSTSLGFVTNSTVKATLDSSGNLGLGVTPSGSYKLQVAGGALLTGLNVSSGGALNSANTATFDTDNAGAARFYSRGANTTTVGSFQWRLQSSNGSVDTQAMTLDTAGNLGLGVTPSAWQSSTRAIQVGASGFPAFVAEVGGDAWFGYNAFYDGAWKYRNTFNASGIQQTAGAFRFLTAPSGTAGNAISFTQAMTLDSSGNLLVGTTGSGARMRVDSAGATSGTSIVQFNNSSAVEALRVRSDGAVFTGSSVSGLAACPYNNTTANAANMVVGTGGDLQRSTSSLKYKTDVQDAVHGLAEVMQLRPVTYKGKNDGGTVFGGLIAEEVHASGLTEFVQYASDGSPDALAYGQMVSLAFKAIQEQQAIITALTARVAALESN